MATLDATTAAEYAAEVNASDKAQVIIDALSSTVYARIYNDGGVMMGEGTMTSPWGTISGGNIVLSTMDDFFVSSVDTVNSGWYMRLESGSRFVRFTFGLAGSGKEAEWSLSSWSLGTRAGISVGEIVIAGNRPPVWSGVPSTLSFQQGVSSTHNFGQYATDPDDDTITYSLPGSPPAGFSIAASTGVLTISASAAAATTAVTIRATDSSGLYSDTSCSIVVTGAVSKWHPGHGTRSSDDAEDSAAACLARGQASIDWLNDSVYMQDGFAVCMVRWGRINPSGSSYDWTIPDALLAYAKARGRRMILMVMFKAFNQSDSLNLIPADLRTAGYLATGLNSVGQSICIGEMWDAVVMDRFISAIQAIGARYNSDAYFEGVTWPETATWGTNNVNNGAYSTQLQRLFTASKAAFPNSNVFANLNSLTVSGTSAIPTLMEAAYQAGIGFACPDAREETGAQVFRGESGAIRDYRGTMPCLCVVSLSTYEFALTNRPADPTGYIVDWLQAEGCTHHAYRKYTWWNDALASIAADPGVASSCPLVYNGSCSSN